MKNKTILARKGVLTMILMMALSILLASCGKDPMLEDVHFSILGDSFSAFEGYVDPDSNDVWSNYPKIGVTEPEQMWWHQVAVETGWTMDRNNSFSGALLSNFDDFDAGAYYGPQSYLRRMDNLGNPDVIFIFGATNDIYHRAPLGSEVYADWTEEQLSSFRPAMAYLLDNLKRLYPKAELYVMVDMELCINDNSIEEETRQAYIESMHRIANHYQVKCIDIYHIHKDWWHPDERGQTDIARQVVETVWADFSV